MKSNVRIPGKRFVMVSKSWADVRAVILIKDNIKKSKHNLVKKKSDTTLEDICLLVLVSYKEEKELFYIEKEIETEIRYFFPNIIVLAINADVYHDLLRQGHKFVVDFLSYGIVIYPWDGYRQAPDHISVAFKERTLEDKRIIAKNFQTGFELAEAANMTLDFATDAAYGFAYYSCCHLLSGYILHQIGWRSNRTDLDFLSRFSIFINPDIASLFPIGQKGERRKYWLQLGSKQITDVKISNDQPLFRKRTKEKELEELDEVLKLIETILKQLTPKELFIPTKKLKRWITKMSERKQK